VTTSSRSDCRAVLHLTFSLCFSSSTTWSSSSKRASHAAASLQPARAKLAGPHAPGLLGGDEPGLLQDTDVLLHAGQGHVELLGEVRDRGVCTPERPVASESAANEASR